MKDRKVTVKFKNELFNVCLVGEAKFKGNRQLSLFSLTIDEARVLMHKLYQKLYEGDYKK